MSLGCTYCTAHDSESVFTCVSWIFWVPYCLAGQLLPRHLSELTLRQEVTKKTMERTVWDSGEFLILRAILINPSECRSLGSG